VANAYFNYDSALLDGQVIRAPQLAAYFTELTEAFDLLPNPATFGTVDFEDGTVSAPSITFDADQDTGFWRPAANEIAASVGGAEIFRLTSTGFGVGEDAPTARIHASNSSNGAAVAITAANTYYAASSTDETVCFRGEFFQDDVGANRVAGELRFGKIADFASGANASAFFSLALRNAGTLSEVLRVTNAGNFLIGTTTGTSGFSLQVEHSGSNKILNKSTQPGLVLLESDVVDNNSWIDNNAGQFRLLTANDALSVFTTRLTIDHASGSAVFGNAAIATTATGGFVYIPSCAGTPTGVPTGFSGRIPLVVDSTNNKLYFYSGGAWRDAGP